MKYEFGIMSSKYELEAEDEITAYISMSLFINKNIPIAIFSPKQKAIMPEEVLDNYKEEYNPKSVRNCLNTIKEVQIK